jgi:hypothetical protein
LSARSLACPLGRSVALLAGPSFIVGRGCCRCRAWLAVAAHRPHLPQTPSQPRATATSTPVYFCDPVSPWQRGSNENTNDLLRQYFPKSSDLSVHTAEDLTTVAAELNNRPRKILGWEAPVQQFTRLLAKVA